MSPGRRLRNLIADHAVMVPGVFNPLIAKMAERANFEAIYLSGAALTASIGLPDIGLATATEFADAIRSLTRNTSLPLIADADTGFGEALATERTVRLYEQAGAAALHLEDQQMPKRCGHLSGKVLEPVEVMESKIRAAVSARRDADFVIIARTDARGVSNFEDAVTRANRYREAGADVIFPEAMESIGEFQRFARECPGPLLANMTEFGKSPIIDFETLAEAGYRLVIYPVTSLRIALKAVADLFADLQQHGHQRGSVEKMMTRTELYDLLGYTGYEERDRAFFSNKEPRTK